MLTDTQDQRLVGFSSLCLSFLVRCNANMVSKGRQQHDITDLKYNMHLLVIWKNQHKLQQFHAVLNVLFVLPRPDGVLYKLFRNQFLAYSVYQSKLSSYWKHIQVSTSGESKLDHYSLDLHRFCPVSSVLLPEWVSVQIASTGRKTQHGSDRG